MNMMYSAGALAVTGHWNTELARTFALYCAGDSAGEQVTQGLGAQTRA